MMPFAPVFLGKFEYLDFLTPSLLTSPRLRTHTNANVMHGIRMVDSGNTFFSMYERIGNDPLIEQYSNSTPYQTDTDTTSVGYIQTPVGVVCTDFCFSASGMVMFVIGWTSAGVQNVYQYNLNAAWSFTGLASQPTPNETYAIPFATAGLVSSDTIRRIAISDVGDKLYLVVDKPTTANNDIVEFSLSSNNSIASVTYTQTSEVPSVYAGFFDCHGFNIFKSGKQFVFDYGGYIVSLSAFGGDSSTLILQTESASPISSDGDNGSRGSTIEKTGQYCYGMNFYTGSFYIYKYEFV